MDMKYFRFFGKLGNKIYNYRKYFPLTKKTPKQNKKQQQQKTKKKQNKTNKQTTTTTTTQNNKNKNKIRENGHAH